MWYAIAELGKQGLATVEEIALKMSSTQGFVVDAGVLCKYVPPSKPIMNVDNAVVRHELPPEAWPDLYAPNSTAVRKEFPPAEYPTLYKQGDPRSGRVDITIGGG